MIQRVFVMALAACGAMAAMALPASAEGVIDDFMCSTFSSKCNQQKPLPPPQLAPGTEPVAAPEKHTRAAKKHKVKRTAAPAEAAPTSPPAPDAAK